MASAFVIKEDEIKSSLKSRATIRYKGKETVVPALWDTGATNSCISMGVVKQLGLTATGYIPMTTPAGPRDAGTYLVDIFLPNNVPVNDLMVCDSEIGDQGIGLLIGMDIISQGDFAVSNYNGKTVFSFRMPSENVLDFVAGIRLSNIMGASRNTGKYNPKKGHNHKKKR